MKPILELVNLNYSTAGKQILKGACLKIAKSKIHSIMGVNGTGKTTLTAVIMGLEGYKPTGNILFNGTDITNLSITERARLGMTLAWQIPANFEGITVEEYLTIGEGCINPEKCLKKVGLDPEAYLKRKVDEKLSGGERKRIELASVFSIKPKLVILDEPDSGIDITSINSVKRIIRNFKSQGTSVVLITHNETIAKLGDSASLLCEGEIVKKGNSEDVISFFKAHCRECENIGEKNEELLK